MQSRTAITSRVARRLNSRGSLLLEVSIAMGVAAILGLLMMKGSLLAISNTQWTVMQTLTDAYLSRETALSNRVPVADLTGAGSLWPDSNSVAPTQETVTIGKLMGGTPVTAKVTRFRVVETPAGETDTSLSVWRLHSVLTYKVGDDEYVKSRTTLRMQ
jgi:hypothetical protein